MASALVPTADAIAFLGSIPAGSDAVLEQLIDDVETLFLAQCGRSARPFQAAETGRVEVKDGTGSRFLWLDYEATALTELVIGFDFTDPDETLDTTDVQVLAWHANSRRIVRRDGGRFGCLGEADVVRVTYDAAADLPRDVAVAITRVVASVWRQRGSEDVKAERIGPYDATYTAVAEQEPLWQLAVANHREVRV